MLTVTTNVEGKGPWIKMIGIIVSVSTGLFSMFALTFGGYAFLDKRYAMAVDHKALELRVTINEVADLRIEAMREVYFFRKQARLHPDDFQIKEKLKEAEESSTELKDLSLKLKEKQKNLRSKL